MARIAVVRGNAIKKIDIVRKRMPERIEVAKPSEGRKRKYESVQSVPSAKRVNMDAASMATPMAVDIIVQMILENIIETGNKILNTLGSGHTESVYHKAFEVEFRKQGIEYASEVVAPIYYRGTYVGHGRADIVIPGILVMELKATSSPPRDLERSRIKTYMESLRISDGIIINFSQKQKKCMVMII